MFNNIPIVTKNILIINVLVYIVCLVSESQGGHLSGHLAAHYINSPLFEPYQIVSHMFAHDLRDVSHILFNMLLLVFLGSHLEHFFGTKKFFIFYFVSGIGAFLIYNLGGMIELNSLKNELYSQGYNVEVLNYKIAQFDFSSIYYMENQPESTLNNYVTLSISSAVGASGALFGILAAFMFLFPNTELQLLFIPIPIKAKYLIGAYIAFEVYNAFYKTNDSIAHLAHVGGAITGFLIVLYWRKFDKQNFY